MARPARNAPAPAPDPEALPPALDVTSESLAPGEALDLDTLMAELPEAPVIVVLHRVNDKETTQWDYLDRMAANDFTLEAVKQQYGGGKYRATIFGVANRHLRRVPFRIDPRFKPAALAAIVPGSSEVSRIENAIAALADVVTRAVTARAPAVERDPLDVALKIVEIMRGGNAPVSPTSELVKTLREGMDLGREIGERTAGGNGGGDGDSFASALKSVEPLIGAVADRLRAEPPRRRALPAGPSEPAPAPAAHSEASVPMAPVDSGPPWAAQVRPHLPHLVSLARINANPESWADAILDMLSDEVYGEFEIMSRRPDFADVVMGALPELAPVNEWARRLLAVMAERMAPEGEDAGPAPAPAS